VWGKIIRENDEYFMSHPRLIKKGGGIMRALWAQNYHDQPKLPIVQQTLIKSWFPWKYYFVSTVQFGLLYDMNSIIGEKDNQNEVKGYVTQMFRCDKHGIVRSFNKPLFEREYSDLPKAINGHKEAIKKLAQGVQVHGPSGNCIE